MKFTPDLAQAYRTSKRGKRFIICDQTAGGPATFAGKTSYVATTPSIMLRKPDGEEGEAGDEHILSNFQLCQDGTPAGGTIAIHTQINNIDRFSAIGAGAEVVPVPMDSRRIGEVPTILKAYVNPTAIALGAAGTYAWWSSYTAFPLAGDTIKLDWLDGVILGPVSSLLIWIVSASPAPTLRLNGEIVER